MNTGPMVFWSRYALTFLAGIALASAITLGFRSRAQAAPNEPTGRQIVGFHSPQTLGVIKQIARSMNANIVQIAPGGAYVLLVPKKPGAKLTTGQDGRVRYIEPEIAMGIDPPAKELLLIVPIKWIPKELLEKKATK